MRPSTGSVGDAYDNAMCESFFATLECEPLDRHRFRSHSEVRMAVFQFASRPFGSSGLLQPLTPPLSPGPPLAHRIRKDPASPDLTYQRREPSTVPSQLHLHHFNKRYWLHTALNAWTVLRMHAVGMSGWPEVQTMILARLSDMEIGAVIAVIGMWATFARIPQG